MDLDIEETLYRIINGYFYINVNNTNYKIVMPGITEKYRAHYFYTSILENNKFDSSWLSDNQIKNLLSTYKLWDDNKEKGFKDLLKALDNAKIQYFLNFNLDTSKKQIKKLIENLNKQINDAYRDKHHFDYLSLESYAQSVKNQYLIYTMVYLEDSRFFKENFETLDVSKLDPFIGEIHNKTLDNESIKKIARHELWRSFWGANKELIFDKAVVNWTDEQRSLVNFARTLDSIREHMEAPSEEIIEDNDALDGWILHQHEKISKEKKQKLTEQKYGLDKTKGQEVFLMAGSREEAREIYDLNDPTSRAEIKEMVNFSNQSQGIVDWSNAPNVQRQIRQQAAQALKERTR